MTVVRDQLFLQKPPGSRFRFSRTGVQPSPGSSTMELLSAFAESGTYPPDRELPGSPRQCSLPLACRHPPEGHQIGARKRRTPENTILSQPYCRRVSTDRPNRESSQLAASLEGEPGPAPAGKTLPHSYPGTRFRRERARAVSFRQPRCISIKLRLHYTRLFPDPRFLLFVLQTVAGYKYETIFYGHRIWIWNMIGSGAFCGSYKCRAQILSVYFTGHTRFATIRTACVFTIF